MLAILLTVLQNLNIKGRAKPLCPHPFRWTTKTRDVPNYFIWIWISLFPPDVPVPTFHCPLVIQFLVCQIPGECKPIVHYNSTLKVFLSMFQFFNLSQKSSSARYSFSHAWTENSSDIWSSTFRGTNGHSCHKINGIFFHVPTKALWMLKLPSWSIQSMVGFIIYELRWSDTPLKIWGVNQRYNL